MMRGYIEALRWVVALQRGTGPGEAAQDATDDLIEGRLREMLTASPQTGGSPIVRRTEDGLLDEVVAKGATVHLEAMSDYDPTDDAPEAHWWLRVESGGVAVTVTLTANAPITATVETE